MIVVTGGAGFIGSVLVHELNQQGRDDILIVDQLGRSPKWKNLMGLRFKDVVQADEFVSGDYLESNSSIECIFHMGANSSTTETDMGHLLENNVRYSQKLFEFCSYNDCPFVYASSAATYGNGDQGYSDDHEQIRHLRPLNPYGFSKQLFDEWVLQQTRRPSHWFGLKFFNVFGPNEYHKEKMVSVVYQATQQIQNSGRVKLFESHKDGIAHGEQKRDFVYVKDCVRAMLALWMSDASKLSGIYNMGTGKARSFADLARATFKALGKEEQIDYIPMPENLRGQYQYFTQAEMTKFQKICPDFHFTELEQAVADYVQQYLIDTPRTVSR